MNIGIGRSIFTRDVKSNEPAGIFGFVEGRAETDTADCNSNTEDILECIKNAKSEWLEAIANYDFAYDEELIDYYTYKLKALEVRYGFYLKKAKQLGIKVTNIDECGESIKGYRRNTVL